MYMYALFVVIVPIVSYTALLTLIRDCYRERQHNGADKSVSDLFKGRLFVNAFIDSSSASVKASLETLSNKGGCVTQRQL